MNQLSEKDRQVVFLCMEGIDLQSMAKRLAISEDMVRYRKEKVYRYLRKHSEDVLSVAFASLFSQE